MSHLFSIAVDMPTGVGSPAMALFDARPLYGAAAPAMYPPVVALQRCSKGCGCIFDPVSGRIASQEGEVYPTGFIPPCAVVGGDATIPTACIPPAAITPLLMATRLPTDMEEMMRMQSPAMELLDPSLSQAPKHALRGVSREMSDLGNSHNTFAMGIMARVLEALAAAGNPAIQVRMAGLIPSAMDIATPAAAGAAGAGAGGAAAGAAAAPMAPMPATHCSVAVAVARALVALATANGLATIAEHACFASRAWEQGKKAEATAQVAVQWQQGPDGSMFPVGLFWSSYKHALHIDRIGRAKFLMSQPCPTVGDALARFSNDEAVTLHGANASLLSIAPRIGLLMAGRASPMAATMAAATWRQLHEAMVAAAAAARKERKAVGGAPIAAPDAAAS